MMQFDPCIYHTPNTVYFYNENTERWPRISTDKTKTYYTLEWGRKKGDRLATGIFTYNSPKNTIERNYNIQSLKNLDLVKSQTLLDLQTKGRGFLSPTKQKENFLDFYEKYVEKNRCDTNRSLPCSFSQFKKFVALDQRKHEDDQEDLFIASPDILPNFCERFRKFLLDRLTLQHHTIANLTTGYKW